MIKIEELVYNFAQSQCDFEKQILLTNHYHADWEADLFLIDEYGFSHEIEIKLSKSDYNNDFKKCYTNAHTGEKFLKHDKILGGDYIANFYSFLLPMGMIPHNKIPPHCGIIEFYHDEDHWETTFNMIRNPQKIHETPYWNLVDKDMLLRRLAFKILQKKLTQKSASEQLIFKNFKFPNRI